MVNNKLSIPSQYRCGKKITSINELITTLLIYSFIIYFPIQFFKVSITKRAAIYSFTDIALGFTELTTRLIN